MTAIPLMTPSGRSAVAPGFGKATAFAYVYGGGEEVEVAANRDGSGVAMAKELIAKGADSVVLRSIELEAMELLFEAGVKLFYAGELRLNVQAAAAKLTSGSLKEVTPENARPYLVRRR